MLRKLCLLLLVSSSTYCSDKADEFKNCLDKYWGVDSHTAAFIANKFKPLLENQPQIIDEFIQKSSKLNIDFSLDKKVYPLHAKDGVICSPKEHLVVFESPYVRIFMSSTVPGETEPFHIHPWKSIAVVVQPADFSVEYANGETVIWNGAVGIYELPANDHYTCTNIGLTADRIFRFEIKD